MMKVIAIIQARMSSTRLPGKILKEVNGKPLLEYQIERLGYSKLLDQIVIATTTKEVDNIIVDFCKSRDIAYFRGSEADVLSRYYEAAVKFKADIVVRITSDCPIIDPYVVDHVIENFINSEVDYVSNTLERTYPRGLDTEVFSFSALERAYNEANNIPEREHVTPHIYLNLDKFTIKNINNTTDESFHRWTVDTIEDFELMKLILLHLYNPNELFVMDDVLTLLSQHSDWKIINAHIEQKKLGE